MVSNSHLAQLGCKISDLNMVICRSFLIQPSFKTAQIHFENKHPKIPFPAEEYQALFDAAKGKKKKDRGEQSIESY